MSVYLDGSILCAPNQVVGSLGLYPSVSYLFGAYLRFVNTGIEEMQHKFGEGAIWVYEVLRYVIFIVTNSSVFI